MNRVPEMTPEELEGLLKIVVYPCKFCKLDISVDEAGWLWGEKEGRDENGDWDETIAFGCPKCNAVGPAQLTRTKAVLAWNVLVA